MLLIQELEAIKARVKEMEEEAEKLKDMQKEIEGSLNLSMSPTSAGMTHWIYHIELNNHNKPFFKRKTFLSKPC